MKSLLRRLDAKHWHCWEFSSHVIGLRVHGSYRRCACGAQCFTGDRDDTLVQEYIPRPRVAA